MTRVRGGAPCARPGFTLLETVLALTVAVLLMAGLYVALDTLITYQRVGRGIVQQSVVARNLLTRMEKDITSELGPIDVNALNTALQNGQKANGGGGGGGGSGGGSGGSGGNSGGGSSGSTTSGGQGNVSASGNLNIGSSTNLITNLMVQGDATHLTLYTSQLPLDVLNAPQGQTPPTMSDLRCVNYWLAGGQGNPLGLCRQEFKVITASDAVGASVAGQPFTPPGDEKQYVISDKVLNVTFQYFDGNSWQDSWDGTVPQSSSQSSGGSSSSSQAQPPVGPPMAIAINLTVLRANSPPGRQQGVTFRHVVAIPTANNLNTALTQSSSGTTTGSGQ
jgi:uncharacterized membrane protein YgcG